MYDKLKQEMTSYFYPPDAVFADRSELAQCSVDWLGVYLYSCLLPFHENSELA